MLDKLSHRIVQMEFLQVLVNVVLHIVRKVCKVDLWLFWLAILADGHHFDVEPVILASKSFYSESSFGLSATINKSYLDIEVLFLRQKFSAH